ncbi:hypothetical protein [Micromonospora sp. NBC_01813]|uniref:hypothetical protein n=1 Tax=Micromonospora sp. NBC_01813 TaxID=2975988 RepID=UPI002DD814BE|nr:hypothetical protein [Micromonospora sp. NBC_01813]WSA10908.1 hypothetical protein OG958_09100 [Micromonospora sp. NBC_01813]
MNSDAGPDAWRDLHVGLATADSLQTSIRHADAKALALLATEGGVAATVADQVLPVMLDGNSAVVALTVFLAAVMAVAMLVTTCQLAMSLRPRLTGAGGANRFGFPDIVAAGGRPSAVSVQRHRDEAWDFVVTLARIALVKHLLIQACMPWFMALLGSAGSMLLVSGVSGATP